MSSEDGKHPLPVPIPPRAPKGAKVVRTTKKKDPSGELLSVSEWALQRLESRYDGEGEGDGNDEDKTLPTDFEVKSDDGG